MGNTRIYVFPTSFTVERHLRCRLYSSSLGKPRQVTMLTRCSDPSRKAERFPVPESLLDGANVQPYVHNCCVTLHEGRHKYQFCIFFKQHCHLGANTILSSIDHIFRGDAVIMRIGASAGSVVNMRARDKSLADFVMHRFTRSIKHYPRAKLPRALTVVKPLSTRVNRRLAAQGHISAEVV
ncbi:hypothetical protein F4604DRAFT_1918803 [Suillus subluteus]|nr:hypothetical protein F4604DRAFT_1918803 [Suillus subluteus]